MATTSKPFNIVIESQRIYKRQAIKYEGKTMMVTNIKEVEQLEDGKLRVSGTWKPNYVDQLLTQFSRK